MKTSITLWRLALLAACSISIIDSPAVTVTYVMQDANFPTQFNDGGNFYNSGDAALGMWANTGNKNTAAWRTFKTAGDNTGSNRSLQIGDVFKITVSATRAYGQIGFSLNASGSQGSSYDNRVSGSRLYFNTDNHAAWYVNRSGGTSPLSYLPLQSIYKDYIFTVRITSETTADVFLTVDGTDYRAYNLTMNGSAGANIDAFSIYGSDMWDGDSNEDAFWKQTSTVENTGLVQLGYFMTSGTYNPGKIADGLVADSTSSSSVNAVIVGGDAGTAVVLDDANTFTGGATVNANATARLQHLNGFGTTDGGVNVTAGGKIEISGSTSVGGEALTLNGAGISSSGALQNTSGNNTWGGPVAVVSDARIASDSDTLTLSGDVDFQNTGSPVNARTLTIAGAGNTLISGNLSNAATGSSVLAKIGAGTLTLAGSSNAVRLLYNHSGGVISISGANQIGVPAGVNYPDKFNFLDNATLHTTNSFTLGRQVSGTDNAGFRIADTKTGTFDVAAASTLTIDGVIANISGAGNLTKTGNGTLILQQANTYSGATTLNQGTLLVNGSLAAGSAVGVADGATLGGTGTISGTVTVNSGGTLAPGASIGTLTLGAAPALNGTNLMEINKAAAVLTADKLNLTSGVLAYGGTLTVTASGDALSGGEVFDLFDSTGGFNTGSSFSTLNLPTLPVQTPALNWFTSNLTTEGTIIVNRAPTAVDTNYTRSFGLPLTIAIGDLLALCSDPDSGDAVVFQAVANGTFGTVATNATSILYTPSANNNDTLVYTVRDNRGGTKTASINIAVGAQPSSTAQSITVTNGTATVVFQAVHGLHYDVERSGTSSEPWEPLASYTNVTPDANAQILVTDTPPNGWTSAFYRLKWLGN